MNLTGNLTPYLPRRRNLRALKKARRRRGELRELAERNSIEPVRLLPPPRPHDLICLLHCRDEALRLPDFFDHHRRLGVDRFAVVDNKSQDESRELLYAQPDVDLYEAKGSMSTSECGMTWTQQLFDHYGSHRWYLVLDVDELFVFTGMEGRGLHDVTRNLDRRNRLAMTSYMIDLYPDCPLEAHHYTPGDSMIESAPLFDGTGYRVSGDGRGITKLFGGPRKRLFGIDQYLHKVPLLRHSWLFAHVSVHEATAPHYQPKPEAALLHFKLFEDFRQKVAFAVESREHWEESREYRDIDDSLLGRPSIDCRFEGSRRYEGPECLVDAGLIHPIPW